MGDTQPSIGAIPAVLLVGHSVCSDFQDVAACLFESSLCTTAATALEAANKLSRISSTPELIVLVQDRPGCIAESEVELIRRQAPLSGIVCVLGSWCEGETRSGRPLSGVRRLDWYEFPVWWQRQLVALAAGECPEWARPFIKDVIEYADGAQKQLLSNRGLVLLETTCWETGNALGDVLQAAGFATAWSPPGRHETCVRGAVAGIWEGRQLDDSEAARLKSFSDRFEHVGAPIIALLDFPRRDRVETAREAGAVVVLGKPWLNVDLVAALTDAIERELPTQTHKTIVRAA